MHGFHAVQLKRPCAARDERRDRPFGEIVQTTKYVLASAGNRSAHEINHSQIRRLFVGVREYAQAPGQDFGVCNTIALKRYPYAAVSTIT